MDEPITDEESRPLPEPSGSARPIDWKKIEAITQEIAALPILDSRPIDEILGYDEFGLPS